MGHLPGILEYATREDKEAALKIIHAKKGIVLRVTDLTITVATASDSVTKNTTDVSTDKCVRWTWVTSA